MRELEEIMKQIEELRLSMVRIKDGKTTLTDQEVITASQMLDAVLNEYYKVLKSLVDKNKGV
ncbi:aspartyl-phosphate phosphatase Spo0E family protein [Desulfosporosinus meridiei]|uniref:Spo0E like sporulation regulatory protein n=1 Tax=Desulfosporosinus meridiei (strain ATCC BAA-275 / DSM 13257 / KCTC 12902 / NCIMB 13706 / S10) TaxID=768704 RepID=J7IWY8_DESMD|nr:aspartyl-phosphate phosphatase Spo0E family protein [Desulfosporosinus meridiei]AFQ46245.1 Spo0E like sporulation regulatory protein [Desulfosporosinus meridiei DSM 13257]